MLIGENSVCESESYNFDGSINWEEEENIYGNVYLETDNVNTKAL